MTIRSWLLVTSLSLVCSTAGALTVAQLVESHLETRGGTEKLKAIQGLQYTGKPRRGRDAPGDRTGSANWQS